MLSFFFFFFQAFNIPSSLQLWQSLNCFWFYNQESPECARQKKSYNMYCLGLVSFYKRMFSSSIHVVAWIRTSFLFVVT